MPKATFKDFLEENPMYQSLSNNRDARKIFDFLNENENIFGAIKFSKMKKPALMASVEEIETYIDKRGENATIDLKEDFNRQGVGKMQKTILAPFGYTPIKNSQKSFKAKYFRTASCYELTDRNAKMKIAVVVNER